MGLSAGRDWAGSAVTGQLVSLQVGDRTGPGQHIQGWQQETGPSVSWCHCSSGSMEELYSQLSKDKFSAEAVRQHSHKSTLGLL